MPLKKDIGYWEQYRRDQAEKRRKREIPLCAYRGFSGRLEKAVLKVRQTSKKYIVCNMKRHYPGYVLKKEVDYVLSMGYLYQLTEDDERARRLLTEHYERMGTQAAEIATALRASDEVGIIPTDK